MRLARVALSYVRKAGDQERVSTTFGNCSCNRMTTAMRCTWQCWKTLVVIESRAAIPAFHFSLAVEHRRRTEVIPRDRTCKDRGRA